MSQFFLFLFCLYFFSTFTELLKNLLAKYCQDNIEKLQNNQSFSEEEKEKNDNMVVNNVKISLKMKNKN